jgi:hypothetical protein
MGPYLGKASVILFTSLWNALKAITAASTFDIDVQRTMMPLPPKGVTV